MVISAAMCPPRAADAAVPGRGVDGLPHCTLLSGRLDVDCCQRVTFRYSRGNVRLRRGREVPGGNWFG